jgi:hypothetical protein
MTRVEAKLLAELVEIVIKATSRYILTWDELSELQHIKNHFDNAAKGYGTKCARGEHL